MLQCYNQKIIIHSNLNSWLNGLQEWKVGVLNTFKINIECILCIVDYPYYLIVYLLLTLIIHEPWAIAVTLAVVVVTS